VVAVVTQIFLSPANVPGPQVSLPSSKLMT